MKRTIYHTDLKLLFYHNLQACLTNEQLQSIPSSNQSRWGKEPPNRYNGNGLNQTAKEKLEMMSQFAKTREIHRTFMAYTRLKTTLITILSGAKNYQNILRDAKEQIIEVVDRVSPTLPIKKVIKAIGISRSTYQSWWQEVKVKCDTSVLFRCRGRYPFQLTIEEIETIKQLLTSPKLAHWPICSIAHFARRQGLVIASLQSWYRYTKFLGLNKPRIKRKSKQKPGLKASRPNQYWHADITIFKTLDGAKHYIYLVVDNFSRKILSCKISDSVSGLTRMETLREAWINEVHRIKRNESIDLIVDGGPENVNHIVDTFVNRQDIHMNKLIAMEDIAFSNSMVEATNKEIKYRYLFPNNIPNRKQLHLLMPGFVHDFNDVRPHGQLNGATPNEAHAGIEMNKENIKSMLRQAQAKRPFENRKSQCGRCI